MGNFEDATKPIEDALNAMGAMAELAGVMCRALTQNGFTRQEAVEITTRYLIELLTSK